MKLVNIKKIISGGIIRKRIMTNDNDQLFLIFPGEANKLSYYGLLFADEYSLENNINRITVISSDETIFKVSEYMIDHPLDRYNLSTKKMDDLLYNLSFHVDYMGESVFANLLFISDLFPYGESTKLLHDNGIFDESYFVWNRIYNQKNFYRSHEPAVKNVVYNGEDRDVLIFLKLYSA